VPGPAATAALRRAAACLLAALVPAAAAANPEWWETPGRPDLFPQVVGTQNFDPAYRFTEEPPLVEGAREIARMGSRILKTTTPPPAQLTQLLGMPFTHYLLWFRSSNRWTGGLTEEMRRQEYDATFAFARDLLTRPDAAGKTFLLGHWEGDWYLLPNKRRDIDAPALAVDGMVAWLNVRQRAIEDARRAVPDSRARVYQYAEVNRVRDAMVGGRRRMVDQVLPRVDVDLVSYSAYDSQQLPAAEVRATLDYINRQLRPKPGLPAKRVFIGECGLSWVACGSDPAEHDRRNREILAKLLSWRPAMVLYWQVYNNEVKDGRQLGFWLIDDRRRPVPLHATLVSLYAQQAARARSAGPPSAEESAALGERLLAPPAR